MVVREASSTACRLIDGKACAAVVRAEVRLEVEGLRARGIVPGLCVVLVGEDPASQVYVRNKDRAAQEAGFAVRTLQLASSTRQDELLELVMRLNADGSVHGILVQLPLPAGIDARSVVRALDPKKDVDGLHPENVAKLVAGDPSGLRPCTPEGCLELCHRHGIELSGRRVVVLGRSMLVGKPVAMLALERHATVTICHSRTRDLPVLAREADVLVAAVGRAEMVRGSWIKPGAAVLDVGINRPEGETGGGTGIVGDVCFAEAREVAGWLTPVPGGVGPMTVAMLLRNTARAAARSAG